MWVAASRNGKILTKKYRDGKKKMTQGEHGRDCFLKEEPILTSRLRSAAALNLKPHSIDGESLSGVDGGNENSPLGRVKSAFRGGAYLKP